MKMSMRHTIRRLLPDVLPPDRHKDTDDRDLKPPALKLLVTIVNRDRADLYLALLQSFKANYQCATLAEGTATEDMRRLLGLTNTNKAVLFSILREDYAPAALDFLEDKFTSIRGGKGIAFTVPFSGIIGAASYEFLSNHMAEKED